MPMILIKAKKILIGINLISQYNYLININKIIKIDSIC